jgi:lipopolysaccharide export system ATP-binding protein
MVIQTGKKMTLVGRNLYKSFKDTSVVSDVSLSVQTGEIVGLFGANGAGKTTCFLLMAGLMVPNKGTITLNGTDVTRQPLYKRAREGLRYLPQDASIIHGLSVEDNLYAVAELFYSRPKYHQIVDDLLKEFRLTTIRHKKGAILSGGQRRRVEIARTLIGRPSFILFDEPLAGIDPKSIQDLALLIKSLSCRNIGILITDHNVKDMLPLVDRAYIMHDGRIIGQGSPEEIIHNQEVRTSYLGTAFPSHIESFSKK